MTMTTRYAIALPFIVSASYYCLTTIQTQWTEFRNHWTEFRDYQSAESHQERYEAARYAQLEARIEKNRENSLKFEAAYSGPIAAKPLERNLVLRRQQVRDWLSKANFDLSQTWYSQYSDEPVPTKLIDHGIRIKYFANGLYFIRHPEIRRSDVDSVAWHSIEAGNLLRDAPNYKAHYIVYQDTLGKACIIPGDNCAELSDEDRELYVSLYGYPDYDAYRRYREKMRPEMERHKRKRERELIEHLQRHPIDS